jgi:hypothetical protein
MKPHLRNWAVIPQSALRLNTLSSTVTCTSLETSNPLQTVDGFRQLACVPLSSIVLLNNSTTAFPYRTTIPLKALLLIVV